MINPTIQIDIPRKLATWSLILTLVTPLKFLVKRSCHLRRLIF